MAAAQKGSWKEATATLRRGVMHPLARTRYKLGRLYDYLPFVGVVMAVIVLAVSLDGDDKIVALKAFAVLYFSLLPAILYLQFTARRTPTVWREYVLTLFRLHADDYSNLPEPAQTSRYHAPWKQARCGLVGSIDGIEHVKREEQNVYRRRFEEQYGPLSMHEDRRDWRNQSVQLHRAHKLQVLVATLLITIGWVFVVQPETVYGRSFTPGDFELRGLPAIPAESFAFAFLGAYFFVLQMLVRRFFQNDLKPTAYVNATMRIIIVILLVWVLDPLLPDSLGQAERSAIAFAIGVFPAIGWQALQSVVAVLLKRAVPSLEAKDPLSELDGMNVWYEARLVEEGIDGVQNLATVDIGNALLRTRIPPERLINWIDQALLRMHARKGDVEHLKRFGIHKATDLLDALAYRAPGQNGRTFASEVEELLNSGADRKNGRPSVTRAIAVALQGERNLKHILAWRSFSPKPDLKEQKLLKHALTVPTSAGGNGGQATVQPPVPG